MGGRTPRKPASPPSARAGAPATASSLTVTEIYKSLQGESSWAGLPCTFVRLTGCPLRCRWCDTAYAFTGGESLTLDAIVARVAALGARLVEVTGGEPLAQDGTAELCRRLLAAGHEVLVETSGAQDVSVLPAGAVRIMDLKCPGSGEVDRNLWTNLEHLRRPDEVKFVIADRRDYDWARDVLRRTALADRLAVLMSPVTPGLDPRLLAEWVLADGLAVRFQIQVHKVIWGADARGV